MTKKEKIVLFLGNAETESATSKLKATKKLYKRKMLDSSVENWSTIIDHFDEYDVSCVVVKLTTNSFNTLSSEEYVEVANNLLKKLSTTPSLILAHESLLTGVQSRVFVPDQPSEDDYDPYFEEIQRYRESEFNSIYAPPTKEVINQVKCLLKEHGLNIVPYQKNVELSLLSSSFIEKNEHNLIFRIYVPSGRLWASEAEKLLELFRDYLQKASGLNARHAQYKTNNGVVHEFFGDDEVSTSALSEKFAEFSGFMDACIQNPDSARTSLASSNLDNREVQELVLKYSREARRLHIDLKHDRERRFLNIKQELESQLAEYVVDENDWIALNQIVENSIPQVASLSNVLGGGFKQIQPIQNLYVNSQVIETANGIISKEISGTVNLSHEAKELISLIEQYANNDKEELVSAVHELSDESVRESDRLSAKQKLKGFLLSCGSKVESVAMGVLQTFIESQLGL